MNLQKLSKLPNNLLFALRSNPWILNKTINFRKNNYITCTGKKDGVGAQTLAILSTMLFANDAGLTYIHTPFIKIEHNNDQNTLWEVKWEEFFNLGKNELPISHVDNKKLKKIDLKVLYDFSLFSSDIFYSVTNCHKYSNLYRERYVNLIPTLREKYYSSSLKKENLLHLSTNKINIAIHIRRGDVTKKSSTLFRFTDNLFVGKVLYRVLEIFKSLAIDYSVHLYSQGSLEDFNGISDSLSLNDIHYHLNECEFSTFHNMVSADVLIMSKSTFSYVAAILSKGIKLYEPFIHLHLSDWEKISSEASFSENKFQEKLLYLIQHKS